MQVSKCLENEKDGASKAKHFLEWVASWSPFLGIKYSFGGLLSTICQCQCLTNMANEKDKGMVAMSQ